MQTSNDIRAQFGFFVATLKDGDYMVEDSGRGAYDMPHDPTYITVKGGKVKFLYQDLWCGSGVEGECYRNHRNGQRAAYPARLDNAQDITSEWEEIAAEWPNCQPSDGWR